MKLIKGIILISFFSFFGCKKQNELIINSTPPLQNADFKIEMHILGSSKPKTKIFDGKMKYEVLNGYGENDWLFNYKDSLYASFRHFKTNRNDKHKYNINFFTKNDVIYANVSVNGVSSLNKVIAFSSKKKW